MRVVAAVCDIFKRVCVCVGNLLHCMAGFSGIPSPSLCLLGGVELVWIWFSNLCRSLVLVCLRFV